MKRHSDDTETIVYAYGCGQPLSGWLEATAENDRCVVLWNRLVDIERRYETEIETAARADVPEIDALLNDIERLTAAINVGGEDGGDRRVMVTARRAARAKLRPLVWAWRKEHKEAMRDIEQARRKAVIEARKAVTVDATDHSRMYWPNSNAVIQRYDISRTEVAQRGLRLRYHDMMDDSGCLTVQIQRTRSGLGANPSELQDGTLSMLAIGAVPETAHDEHAYRSERRSACRTLVEMRVNADGDMIRLPLWYHRPLPTDARVKQAQLTWRRDGTRLRYQLCLTVSRQRQQRASPGGGDVTVRIAPELAGRALRVATITDEAGQASEIILDPHWMDMMDRVDWLPSVMANEALPAAQRIRARLERPGLWGRLLRRRREVYRLIARSLAMRYATVRVHTPPLSELAYIQRGEGANSLRHRACAHVLVAEIKHQCAKHGAAFEEYIAEIDASTPVPLRVRRRRNNGLAQRPIGETAPLAEAAASA